MNGRVVKRLKQVSSSFAVQMQTKSQNSTEKLRKFNKKMLKEKAVDQQTSTLVWRLNDVCVCLCVFLYVCVCAECMYVSHMPERKITDLLGRKSALNETKCLFGRFSARALPPFGLSQIKS